LPAGNRRGKEEKKPKGTELVASWHLWGIFMGRGNIHVLGNWAFCAHHSLRLSSNKGHEWTEEKKPAEKRQKLRWMNSEWMGIDGLC
jgi:hypothetical protein